MLKVLHKEVEDKVIVPHPHLYGQMGKPGLELLVGEARFFLGGCEDSAGGWWGSLRHCALLRETGSVINVNTRSGDWWLLPTLMAA